LQLKIEEQDSGVVARSVSEVPAAKKIVECLHAITHNDNLIGKIIFFEGS
jgi:hypothetical protein